MKNRSIFCRFLGFFCLALIALPFARAWGYTKMENDRILLMNNDKKTGAVVTYQGYYDTNVTDKTHWVHVGSRNVSARYLLAGTNHVMYAGDVKLWELQQCRAGSGTVVGDSGRNYIPWSPTARSILDNNVTNIPEDSNGEKEVGTISMRNMTTARIYSPYYAEGIGTIYFDAVNSFVAAHDIELDVQIATNAVDGVDFATADNSDDNFDWRPCRFDVFAVTDGTTLTQLNTVPTNILVLASEAGGSALFYRVRACINYYGPMRFRIRRLNATGGAADTTGLAMIDNLIASYPPMTATLGRYGVDYDKSLNGSDVIGVQGDLSAPLLSVGQTNIVPYANFSFTTNAAVTTAAKILNPMFYYRWRYLNQKISEWRTIEFDQATITSDSVGTTNLVGNNFLELNDGTGDLEYYFAATLDAPYYAVRDYAFTGASPKVGYGNGWTEQISAITNRATYTAADALPSGGTDWFTRIREGASDYAHIRIVGEVTTNGAWGVKMTELRDIKGNLVKQNERDRMELVGDHTWRYHYYIPTNAVGERIRFHFEGAKYETNGVPFVFNVTTNVWYANSTNVPYLPYTMAASGSAADKYDAIVELDGSATHLQIDFNDEVGTFALTRGTYQNFNMWSDASVGYRGHASETSGVSDVKTRWDADINEWTPTSYERPSLWREAFEVEDGDARYPYYRSAAPNGATNLVNNYGAWTTPNGWNSENAAFVPRERIAPFGHSIQLMGEGKGSLMLNNLPAQYIPNGVGEVEFAARVSQVPSFDGFCYNFDDTQGKNYAISAKVTMSQLYDNVTSTHRNPLDISPANPSVSLVGYYRGTLLGCYEFRVTRSGDQQLTVALYRWRKGEATELVKNVLNASGSASLATGQTALHVGGTLSGWTTDGSAYNSFNNLLIPKNTDDVRKNNERWTCMCFSLYTDESTNEVRLDGFLSTEHNTSYIDADKTKTIRVIAYKDGGSDLKKGTFGVGSVGCQAGFGMVYTHDFKDSSAFNQGLDIQNEHKHVSTYDEWERDSDRWSPYASGDTVYNASGFKALIPANQTVKLKFQKQGDKDGWVDSGWETNIVAFATNTFVFAPCVAPDYLVRLETGSGDAEIVIDSVEVRSWRASDTPNLSSQNGHYDEWAYTMASIETSAEIAGASYKLQAASTNGYAFIFDEAGIVTFTPQIDMEIDRVLLVGGGGAGGWTLGGGGGGGGVLEYDWESAPVTVPAGTTVRIVVGAGGDNYYKNNNDSANWKAGGNGGYSQVAGIPGKGTLTVKGGGGGAGWNQRNAASGQATGGGAAQGDNNAYYSSRASGTTGQGNSGGRAYGDRAGGGGGADLTAAGEGKDANATEDKAGDGGAGRASDITGTTVYYGGGGGGGGGDGNKSPNSSQGGVGGIGGGGNGPPAKAALTARAYMDGTDGLGGGGAGGSHGGTAGTNAGGKGGCGCVILRVRTASKLCVLQPTRGYENDGEEQGVAHDWTYPMSVRSRYMDNGLSLFSFSYRNADSNAVLRLQISTNLVDYGEVYSRTREPADSVNWTTLTNWSFKGLSAKDLTEGTRTYFLSLRSPQKGLMRLIMDPSVVSNAVSQTLDSRDLDYGKIMITRIFCYDEPPLDGRSWWGWNLHNEGWNGGNDPGRWAYLTDSPDGLSCSLNFSALSDDNKTTDPATYGIGLGEPDKSAEYAENNPFVQCPEMTNGIGSVSFRARTFETNATAPSVVLLYGSLYPDSYQPDPLDGQGWTRLAEFVISNNTYQTYSWKTNEMTTAIRAIRLEVGGARNGRGTSYAPKDKAWEKPSYTPYRPIQRVFLDEVTVAEPVGPRMKFFDVRPFRDNLNDTSPEAIPDINDRNEQPLLNESWGIQARLEPQQMEDELDLKSIVVKMAAFVGKRPWGYQNWKDNPTYETELKCVDTTNLIFRSTYDNPASVIQPVGPEDGDSYAVVQYHVWAEYKSKDASEDQKPTTYPLSASDWVMPEWYWPKDFNKEFGLGQDDNFSAFTILDTISPGRAWFNEVNYNNDDYSRDNYQFIELMMPESVDLTDWAIRLTDDTFKKGTMAQFGSPAQTIALKAGKRPGIDSTNHFTVVTFAPPNGASMFPEGQIDGIWNRLTDAGLSLQDGSLKKGNIYGLELMRPSGVVEHQIVVSGTNLWAGSIFESKGDATNFVNDVKSRDGSEAWFWAGEDHGGATDTLGVWRGHGEQFWDGGTTWTNDLTATPGELNLRNGKRQFLDEWMLPPNGTNVWIYAIVTGSHVWQYVDGDPTHTNRNTMMVVQKNASTNIRYKVDAWFEMANCTTNGAPVTPTAVSGQPRTFEIKLDDLQETTTVMVDDRGDSSLFGTNYAWQVAENDPYKPAILDWLLRNYSDKNPEDIVPAEHWFQGRKVGELDLKAMYWLDIPPTDGHYEGGNRVSDWRLLYGFTKLSVFSDVEDDVTYDNNAIVTVQMLLTNTVSHVHYPPYTIQGIEPGSSSADGYAGSSENWTSATFKVTCALDTGDLKNSLKPVKWFVFDRNSFDDDGLAYIEIPDQSKPNVPGFDYGWHYYRGTSFIYKSALSDGASGLYSTEVLRAVHTNTYHSTTSP